MTETTPTTSKSRIERLEAFDNYVLTLITKNKLKNFKVIDFENSLSKEQLKELEKEHQKTLESPWPFFYFRDKAERPLKSLLSKKLLKRGSDYTRYDLI